MFDHVAANKDELSFTAGAEVTVVKTQVGDDVSGEWWEGTTANGSRGHFPRQFVEEA